MAADVPKPLVPVLGRPFLHYPLNLLARHGVTSVVLCVGHLGEQIEAAIGAKAFGMTVRYSYDGPGLDGTLGAVRRARSLLGGRFLVLYADTLLAVDYRQMVRRWEAGPSAGVMSVLQNRNRWGPSNTRVEGDAVVAHSKTEPTPDMEWIDYGVGGLVAGALEEVDASVRDLSDLYTVLAGRRQLMAFRVTERFHEIGTPQALAETERYLSRRADLCPTGG
jgi:NDP-sugar pyrophosphorylase family protein